MYNFVIIILAVNIFSKYKKVENQIAYTKNDIRKQFLFNVEIIVRIVTYLYE